MDALAQSLPFTDAEVGNEKNIHNINDGADAGGVNGASFCTGQKPSKL
jgi:hypothetical protein